MSRTFINKSNVTFKIISNDEPFDDTGYTFPSNTTIEIGSTTGDIILNHAVNFGLTKNQIAYLNPSNSYLYWYITSTKDDTIDSTYIIQNATNHGTSWNIPTNKDYGINYKNGSVLGFNITSGNYVYLTVSDGTDTATDEPFEVIISSTQVLNSSYTYTPSNATSDTNDLLITFKTNTGYVFNTAPSASFIHMTIDGSTTENFTATLVDSKTATISIDLTQYTYVSNQPNKHINIILSANPDLQPEFNTGYSFINLYTLTETQLNELAKIRFEKTIYTSTGSPVTYYLDLGYYITKLVKLYCNIPTYDNITQTIVLADVNTGVTCSLVSSTKTTIDCGTVTIDEINYNSTDYENVEIYGILPFVGKVILDNKIIGHTITLKYNVDIISGDCVAIISNEKDIILDVYAGNMSEDIPYILNNMSEIQGDFNINQYLLYGFIPRIVITYYNNYNDNRTTLLTDNKYSKLSELSGLCFVEHINITIENITNDETDMLVDVLQNGVIF